MKYLVREIEPRDDLAVESVIRSCLIEFGADHEGTAWADPDLCRFSSVYAKHGYKYWVAEDQEGRIVGGAGIGLLHGIDGYCELMKMYCLPEARGTGIADELMTMALDFAAEHYSYCYLETLGNMTRAHRFYEKYGFYRVDKPLVITDHYACEIKYLKKL